MYKTTSVFVNLFYLSAMLTNTHLASPKGTRAKPPTSIHGNSPPTIHDHLTSTHGNSPPTIHEHPTSKHGNSPPTIHGYGDPHDNLLSNHVLPSIACDELDSTAGCVAPCGLTSSCIVQIPAASRWDEWFGMFVILQFRTSKLHPELLRVTSGLKQKRLDKQRPGASTTTTQ